MTKDIVILGSSQVNSNDLLYTRTVKAAKDLTEAGFILHTLGYKGIGAAVREGSNQTSEWYSCGTGHGCIVLPGGYSTLSVALDIIREKQEYKHNIPVIIVGPLLRDLFSSVSRTLLHNKLISLRDTTLWEYAQTPGAAAVKMIEMLNI